MKKNDAGQTAGLGCFAIVAIMIGAAMCLPESESPAAPYWVDGGTLHSASLDEWRRAGMRNRMATAADFVTNLMHDTYVADMVSAGDHNLRELRRVAREMRACIDEVASGDYEFGLRTADTAAMCWVLMGLGPTSE